MLVTYHCRTYVVAENHKKEFSKRYLTEASRQEILKMISNSMEKVAEKVCSRTFISPETNADRVLQIQRILDVVQVSRNFINFLFEIFGVGFEFFFMWASSYLYFTLVTLTMTLRGLS